MKGAGQKLNPPGSKLGLVSDLAVFDFASFGFGQSLDAMGLVLVIEQQRDPLPTPGQFLQLRDRRCACLELADFHSGDNWSQSIYRAAIIFSQAVVLPMLGTLRLEPTSVIRQFQCVISFLLSSPATTFIEVFATGAMQPR